MTDLIQQRSNQLNTHRVSARHLQDDMMKAGTSDSVATIRWALNKQGLHGQTPLLTTRNIKSQLECTRRNLDKTTEIATCFFTDNYVSSLCKIKYGIPQGSV
uniref:Transposase Tc1-like domain-containing protein n=1 Tax=Monopterus albus TaxID=43700 RepID=A0A3Q3Q3V1_MONAL